MRPGVAILAAMVALTAILAGCHQMMNPADPDSPAYGGVPVTDGSFDPDKSEYLPLLPEILEWRSYARHVDGRWIGTPITPDGNFVESRLDPRIGLVFSEEFDHKLLNLVIATTGVTNATVKSNPPIIESSILTSDPPDGWVNGVVPLYNYPGSAIGDPEQRARITVRVINTDGSILGERSFNWLPGDFDGWLNNGATGAETVNGVDVARISDNIGFVPGVLNAGADVNCDGLIDPTDEAFTTGRSGIATVSDLEIPDI